MFACGSPTPHSPVRCRTPSPSRRGPTPQTPPLYHLDKITTPIALFYGGEDYLGDPTDVQRIIDETNPGVVVFAAETVRGWIAVRCDAVRCGAVQCCAMRCGAKR